MEEDRLLKGFIATRSINCATYLCYCNSQNAEIVENETGLRLYAFKDNFENQEVYNKYKSAMVNGTDKLFVDMVKFTKILRYLKQLSKNYKH